MSRGFGRGLALSLLVHLGALGGWSLWAALEPLEMPAQAVMRVQVVTRQKMTPPAPPQATPPKKATPAKPKAPTAPKKAARAPAKASASPPPASTASAIADSTARTSGTARTLPGQETGKTPGVAPAVAWNKSPLSAPKPDYPKIARRMKREGTVLLRVGIAPDGRVERVYVLKKSRFPELDEAAAKAVKGWRFAPDTKGHEVDVPVEFRIDD